jgi:AAA domain-containing protein
MRTSDSPAGANGAAGEPRKKRSKKAKPIPQPDTNGSVPIRDNTKPPTGRLASQVPAGMVHWLLRPWFPLDMLSMVVGLPGVGKSTFTAWLIGHAGTACILPGFEEVVEVMTIPRLVTNGVNLNLVRFLDDRPYRMPRDYATICRILTGWEAQLLIIDPIDSYMEESMNENIGPDVRSYLEAWAGVAKETNCAVVGVRHPGKDRTNVMPGSRQWRAVPRSIVELAADGGTPRRLHIRHYKDSLGQDAKPREYELKGKPGEPKAFHMKGELDLSLNDLSLVASDPTGRTKVLEAAKLIKHMFEQEEKPLVNDLVKACKSLGIGEKARDDAKRLMGIVSVPFETGGKWHMVRKQKDWPVWLKDAES